jgi:hypothetical protein
MLHGAQLAPNIIAAVLHRGCRLFPFCFYSRTSPFIPPPNLHFLQVYVDTYLTGMERGVFEGCLFNVVPIVAYNGQAMDKGDVPIPMVGALIPHVILKFRQESSSPKSIT